MGRMTVTTLSSGKLVNLVRLADASGRFKMLAIDQRDSLRAALAGATGREAKDISYDEMATTKALITEVLSPYSTATLVDPVYGLPQAVKRVPGDVALLVAAEETGYERAGAGGRERKTRLIDGWSVAQAKRAGANAVKLLIPYSPEASEDTRAHQQEVVRTVGEECIRHDLPFLLELVVYPVAESSADTPEFAGKRPHHVIDAAREFSHDDYAVDILKMEFPGDLKYTRQFHEAVFDRKERPVVYDLDDLRGFCRELDATARHPWVILSGGVGIKEFLTNLELTVEAGASGFLCGRAIWKETIPLHPDHEAMRAFLTSVGVQNFVRANAVAERARPWFAHPRFGGWAHVQLKDGNGAWYKKYLAAPPSESPGAGS